MLRVTITVIVIDLLTFIIDIIITTNITILTMMTMQEAIVFHPVKMRNNQRRRVQVDLDETSFLHRQSPWKQSRSSFNVQSSFKPS